MDSPNYTQFDVSNYLAIRPEYPASTFAELKRLLPKRPVHALNVLDLGAGTGLSGGSFQKSFPEAKLTAVDPVASMLERNPCAQKILAPAHDTGLRAQSFDLILIGSALHWLDIEATVNESVRLLTPGGILWIFEYQFPRAVSHPTLNAWIKEQFNSRWKAPDQKPRGSLKTLCEPFARHPKLTPIPLQNRVEMIRCLTPETLTQEILSQSRVLHYLNTLNQFERMEFEKEILSTLKNLFPADKTHLDFDYYLYRYGFKNTVPR